jgi:23S rRNA (uracil1939-C5)-methyltransferase
VIRKQDTIALDIVSIDPSGDGVGRDGATSVFVPFAIPGERVRVRIRGRRGREAWGEVEAIERPSPHRIPPRCPHFGAPDVCGGCTWQHIAYPEQLRLKTDLVRRLVSATLGGRAPEVRAMLPATPIENPWAYRHKAHFVFANATRRGPLIMGHYRRGSQDVFDARECPVHDPRGNAFAFALRDAYARAGVLAAPVGTLRHVATRVSGNGAESMATLVVTEASDARLRGATRRVLDTAVAPDSFHLNVHARPDPYIFGRETRHVRGPRHLREHVAGAAFVVSPDAFFQTNVQAAEILVRLVLEALPPGRPVLDLYAGVGLFAIPLARRGDTVVAVEENRAATKDGSASLTLNRVPPERCRFVAKRVESGLRTIAPGQARHVVLDPPREGCERQVLDRVFGELRPERAAYISCNPEALAAELPVIVGHGYRMEWLQPVDMFPHTPHIETLAILVHRH